MILVVGASGTVGSATIESLKKRNAKVKAGIRDVGKARALGVEGVKFNYEDPSTWPAALKGIETLFFITPPAHPREAEFGIGLVEAAKKAGVKKLVRLSAMGVENNPESALRRIELAIEKSGLRWTFLRPSFFFQNFTEGYGPGIKATGAIALPADKGKTGFIDARDIGEAAGIVLTGGTEHDGKAYTLTGPEPLDHDQVAKALSDATGRKIAFNNISDADFQKALKGWGMSDYAVGMYSALYGFVRAGYTGATTDDLKKLTGSTGRTFAQFARENADAWK